MTRERPMFPPRADERCQIIQFSSAAPKRPKPIVRAAILSSASLVEIEQEPEQPARDERELTVTCQNLRLRKARADVWREADANSGLLEGARGWRTRLRSLSPTACLKAITIARVVRVGIRRWSRTGARRSCSDAYSRAGHQAIAWKSAALAAGDHEHTDIKTERIERAIADDVACLAAHPIRRSNSEAMARRREFNEAMRRRVRDVAAFRGLSDEEIKPTLTLKHHKIAKFTEQHGVRPEWLFEGEGRVFKNDPVTLTGEPQP